MLGIAAIIVCWGLGNLLLQWSFQRRLSRDMVSLKLKLDSIVELLENIIEPKLY